MFLQIKDVTKMFDEKNGVTEISLDVDKGEFITLLGPSGCGKTTLLNLIGGFLTLDSGEIILDGEHIEQLPPEKRKVSTVFQNYALFSHYNVLDNVAYGLRYFRKLPKKEARKFAQDYLKMVGLEDYAHHNISELSGGQQQRVALARGLATNPKVLLLDEPLSNLDANLRAQMRYEIKELQRKYNITMIFVTHDQVEALSMSDRIVVMDKGCISQIGTPKEIYLSPANKYVASFVGNANYIEENNKCYLVRSEDIEISKSIDGEFTIISLMFLGAHTDIIVEKENKRLEVSVLGNKVNDIKINDKVNLHVLNKAEIL
jgi:iron(III) transport system ATP-binding protein